MSNQNHIIRKAYRGFEVIADAVLDDVYEDDLLVDEEGNVYALVEKGYWDYADERHSAARSAGKKISSAKKEYKSIKRDAKREYRDREAIAGQKHLKEYGGRQAAAGAALGGGLGYTVGGKKWAAIGAGASLADTALTHGIYAYRANKARNRKNDVTKALPYGYTTFEKSDKVAAAAGAVPGWGTVTGAGYNATQARKGRRAAVGGRSFGRQMGEGTIGATPGALLVGHAINSGNPKKLALGQGLAFVGGLAGSSHGAYAAHRSARKRGDIEKGLPSIARQALHTDKTASKLGLTLQARVAAKQSGESAAKLAPVDRRSSISTGKDMKNIYQRDIQPKPGKLGGTQGRERLQKLTMARSNKMRAFQARQQAQRELTGRGVLP